VLPLGGKGRAHVREVYVAELRARGLIVPSDLVLDAVADAIARNRDNISAVYTARVLAEMGRDFREALSPFNES
jgi:hypothetical protein